ncbi:MAG: seg [Parcubacteria group bacterium]|nr:seg [Parcubacteria group bacterium]
MLIAIIITGTLLLVATAIMNTSVKQAFLSSAGRESQYAFYAADSGTECAIYWDAKDPQGYSAFSTSTASTITCNKDSANPGNQFVTGGSSAPSTFIVTFLPDPYCAKVTVTKNADNTTKIEALGYNTCDSSNPRRVERAVRVTY